MRLLVTGFTENIGGVETFIMNYYRNFSKTDEAICIDLLGYTEHPAFEQEIRNAGGEIYAIPSPSKRHSYKQLCDFLKENAYRYDAIWCNKCELYNIDFLRAAKKYGIKKRIIHSHNSSNMYSGIRRIVVGILHNINKLRIEKYATDFWACSDYAAKWLFPKSVLENKEVHYIPNAIDVEKFRYNEELREKYRNDMGISNNFVIGSVGRLTYQKNSEFILDIFEKVHSMEKNAVLLMVGIGDLEAQIREKASKMACADAIYFLGKRNDIPQLMQAMDCFLLPSRFEGLPVVAVEAQGAGLPVIAASDGITKQTKLIDSFSFLSLQDGIDEWAQAVLREGKKERKDTSDVILEKGFDIREAAVRVQKELG